MLNLITIDRIFEESWKTYTDDNPYENRDFLTIYLEGLQKEVSLRTDRTLPRLDAFVEAIKPMVGDGALSVNSNGFNVSFAQGDFEYVSKATYYSFGGGINRVPKKSYLRNRVIMTVTW